MPIMKVSKNEYSKEEVKQKLRVDEYVFEINGKDIYNANLIYSIYNNESIIFEDGKKKKVIMEPALNIEINGKDKDGNKAWISFEIKVDIAYLNTLSEIPTNITHLLHDSESFVKKPNEQLSEFLYFELPKNNADDIYKNLSSLWVSKIENNVFVFKLSVPNELFTYFKLIIKKEEL